MTSVIQAARQQHEVDVSIDPPRDPAPRCALCAAAIHGVVCTAPGPWTQPELLDDWRRLILSDSRVPGLLF